MKNLIYVGPHNSVEVKGDRWRVVLRNEVAEFDDDLASRLLEQPRSWREADASEVQQDTDIGDTEAEPVAEHDRDLDDAEGEEYE